MSTLAGLRHTGCDDYIHGSRFVCFEICVLLYILSNKLKKQPLSETTRIQSRGILNSLRTILVCYYYLLSTDKKTPEDKTARSSPSSQTSRQD
jgi:hypothetical protein